MNARPLEPDTTGAGYHCPGVDANPRQGIKTEKTQLPTCVELFYCLPVAATNTQQENGVQGICSSTNVQLTEPTTENQEQSKRNQIQRSVMDVLGCSGWA